MVAVGHEQLELQRLEVVVRNARPREPVDDDEQGVDLAQLPEQLRTCAAHLDDADGRGRHLARVHDLRELVEARVGNGGHADLALRAAARERREQHRLARALQPDDPDFQCQAYGSWFEA